MQEIVAAANIRSGKLILLDRELFSQQIAEANDIDCEVIVRPRANKRTNAHNAIYWGVYIKQATQFMVELGNDVDADIVHEYFKRLFLPHCVEVEEVVVFDTVVIRERLTTRISVSEFIDYLTKIEVFCDENLGQRIRIDPNYKKKTSKAKSVNINLK